jgi:hypothetical protein
MAACFPLRLVIPISWNWYIKGFDLNSYECNCFVCPTPVVADVLVQQVWNCAFTIWILSPSSLNLAASVLIAGDLNMDSKR